MDWTKTGKFSRVTEIQKIEQNANSWTNIALRKELIVTENKQALNFLFYNPI